MPFVALAIVAMTEKGGELKLAADGLSLDIDPPGSLPAGA